MVEIALEGGVWVFDPSKPLGPAGGFGEVFLGSNESWPEVAVKRLHLNASEAAHREIRIAQELMGRNLAHVLPILDVGQDSRSDRYFVVMPRALESLQDRIDRDGPLAETEAVRVLLDVLRGLCEVADLVHRDLKPPNILHHEGSWKIGDFGIARFVEDATSARSLKDCLSPAYAAPEQWLLQRATNSTDIYSLGCVAHAMIAGAPPFPGPDQASYMDQHLKTSPPPVSTASPQLRTLISMMLRKQPDTRPTRDRIIGLLEKIRDQATTEVQVTGSRIIAMAGAIEAEREAARQAANLAATEKWQTRSALASEGLGLLGMIYLDLIDAIRSAAPTAQLGAIADDDLGEQLRRHNTVSVGLGSAMLRVSYLLGGMPIQEGAFLGTGWDVAAGGRILVVQAEPHYEWAANLWYSATPEDGAFRWREVSYFTAGKRVAYVPFAVDRVELAAQAVSRVIHSIRLAWGPATIDDEDTPKFIDRWCTVLYAAYHRRLVYPSALPLGPDYWVRWQKETP